MFILVRWPRVAVFVVLAAAVAAIFVARRRRVGPSYTAARSVIDRHCVACHSTHPTVPAFPIAAGGLVLDTAEQMLRQDRKSTRLNSSHTIQYRMPSSA